VHSSPNITGRSNRRQVEKRIQILVGTHEANTLLAATPGTE